jgi:hypothetical protein
VSLCVACSLRAHSALVKLFLKWLQVTCLEGLGVVLHKFMEVWRC